MAPSSWALPRNPHLVDHWGHRHWRTRIRSFWRVRSRASLELTQQPSIMVSYSGPNVLHYTLDTNQKCVAAAEASEVDLEYRAWE